MAQGRSLFLGRFLVETGVDGVALREDAWYLARAFELADQPVARVSPNPRVGAVLVRDGAIVGEGAHLGPGTAHAEAAAIAAAKDLAEGATLYVTLEPCCHYGHTPPCTKAIIAAGIRRVVAPIEDPNPEVSGKGFAELRAAGITVDVGSGATQAIAQNASYLHWRSTGRPYVTAKWALSLGGQSAARTGKSLYMTGAAAREEAHRLRATSDAVLVGIGTALADDPQLTVRDVPGQSPLRVVLDSAGRLPLSSRLLHAEGRTVLYVGDDIDEERLKALSDLAEVVRLGQGPRLSLTAVLDDLGRRDVTSLLVEGGATVHGAFFDQGLVDRVAVFVAPLVLGGREAPPGVAGLGAESPAKGLRLIGGTWRVLGEDTYFTARVEKEAK